MQVHVYITTSLEHSFCTGPKIGLSLPTLETGSRPLYYLGEYIRLSLDQFYI